MSAFKLNFRQVHLDFHTSPDVPAIGSEFEPDEFAEIVKDAHIDSITCFARCHHGFIYYNSKINPERIHPNLANKDLLNAQIEACHKNGIRVPIYTTVQWDYYTAKQHPEWLCVDENGVLGGQKPYEAGFYGFLCVNTQYRDFLKAHTEEILKSMPVDGLFFDIVIPRDCSCKKCMEEMKSANIDSAQKSERLKYAQIMLDGFKLDMTAFVRSINKECSIFYNRGHIGTAHRPVTGAYSHFELESLPSGGWGYLHFPTTIRYARNLGLDSLGMTGKFHTEWGDFHSFKNKAALEYECFNMLALGAKCSIGDQLEPNGRLSKPVYDLIGSVYSQVEQKEPWCSDANAVTEIGLFTPEEFLGLNEIIMPESLQGAVRMLQESGFQFDIIDSLSEFKKYKVIILPDSIPVNDELTCKFKSFMDNGGSIIASFESGFDSGNAFALQNNFLSLKKDMTLDIYGHPVKGKVFERHDYTDYVMPKGLIGDGLPETEHAMYIKGLEVEASPEAEVLVKAVLPYFDRTYRRFCSHRQAPSSGKEGYDAIIKKDRVLYFAHPIFKQYHINAPKWCKKLVVNALRVLGLDPIVKHNGPSTMTVTVNEQQDLNRWVVHLLHYVPERRCRNMDIIEDVIPLHDVNVSMKPSKNVKSVKLVPQMKSLVYNTLDERIEFTIPKIEGHQMIEMTFG